MAESLSSTDTNLACYEERGFVILPDVLDAHALRALRDALQPYLDLGEQGRN